MSEMNLRKDLVSGVVAGVANVLVSGPLDTARTRIQVHGLFSNSKPSVYSAFYSLYSQHNIRGLYKGLQASLIAAPAAWSIYFPVYNYTRHYLSTYSSNKNLNNLGGSLAGGFMGTILTNPLWLIKARLQASDQHDSIYEVFRKILKQEGPGTFLRGIAVSSLGIIHIGIQFPLYELSKSYLTDQEKPPGLGKMILCSSLPKLVASLVTYPNEVLRSRVYVHNKSTDKRFSGVLSLLTFTWKNEGLRGFYSGFFLNTLRVLPSTFITLYTYEWVSYWLK